MFFWLIVRYCDNLEVAFGSGGDRATHRFSVLICASICYLRFSSDRIRLYLTVAISLIILSVGVGGISICGVDSIVGIIANG